MAGRTSTSIGMGVAVTLLGVLSLALFVTTVIFYSQGRAAQKKYDELNQEARDFVRDGERTAPNVQQIKQAATRGQNPRSVVGYLIDEQESARNEVARLGQTINRKDGELATAQKALEAAEAARDRAIQDRTSEVARVKAIEENYKATITALSGEVDKYKGELDLNRGEVSQFKKDMDERVERLRTEAEDRVASLNSQIQDMTRELVLARDTAQRLQNELRGRTFKPQDEFALVDGQVIGLDAAENAVYISIGARHKVRVGMSFEVYNDATAIRPGADGEYPAGKASIEVIRVDDASATARVTRQKRGNPVVKGDVIANAVYDPSKVYKFLVFGNFDADNDGIPTFQEQAQIRALIEEWGGRVTDELTGDVDFLVLGSRPVLPPAPPGGAELAIIQEWLRLKRSADRYDDLFKKATETSIPVLTENRLYTLIGRRFGL